MSRGSAKPRTQEQIDAIQFPLFQPKSDWKCPTELPSLRGNTQWIGVDIESKDPYLTSKGPGWARKEAKIVGVSLSAEGGYKRYFPVGHAQGQNLAPNVVFEWLKYELAGEEEKRGANLMYDAEGLAYSGVRMHGPLYDVSIVDALIDETQMTYSLDSVAKRRLGYGKNEDLLREAAAMGRMNAKSDIWKMDSRVVGPYAESDAELPSLIHDVQQKEIDAQDLGRVVKVEHELLHVLLAMKLKGVRVDLEKAHKNRAKMIEMAGVVDQKIYDLVGEAVDANDVKHLAEVYESRGIQVPRTEKGNLSITKDFLDEQGDEFSKLIRRARQIEVTRRNNIDYDLLRDHVDGRVYSCFNSVRGEYGEGAESGRFSSTYPNLQKLPSRDPELGPLIRELYIPEPGEIWCKSDYSGQEPSWVLHLAKQRKLAGVDEVIERMKADASMKFYAIATEIINRVSSKSYSYTLIKIMVLGLLYGMGLAKLCKQLNISMDEGKEIVRNYKVALPFATELADQCSHRAQDVGYVRTFLGRRSHFNLFELASRARSKDFKFSKALPYEQAVVEWKGKQIQRSATHKSLNRVVQGSAADQTKLAMLMLWKEHKKTVSIIVHDELSSSVADVEQARVIKHCMESCVELALPARADTAVGPDWAHAKEKVA